MVRGTVIRKTVAKRTQAGRGEAKLKGVEYADPLALSKQTTQRRMAFKSTSKGKKTNGFTTWQGVRWDGFAGPFHSHSRVRAQKSFHESGTGFRFIIPT